MATKCAKCGAVIPDDAEFCPNCGAPKGAAPQAAQPMQSMQPMAVRSVSASPLEGVFNIVFSKTAIMIGVSIGILFVWIGVLIITFAPGSSNIAILLSSMGFGAMSLLLIGGGVWNKRIDKFVRLGMVGIGVYALVQTMSVVGFITNVFNYLT